MELWDTYNANREKIGKMVRGTAFEKGTFHLVIHICIFDSAGRMLIQQRQKDKQGGWPNLWDITVGGSAVAGEDAQTAASRELNEELGICVDLTGIRPNLTVNFDCGFDDIFLVEKDVELGEMVLQSEEVQNVMWATKDEIKQMIADNVFIPYYPSFIDLIFDSRMHYGLHKN